MKPCLDTTSPYFRKTAIRVWMFHNYFLTSAMHHPKTLIGQALLHQTIVNYTKFFSNKIIKVSLFDITI